MPGFSPRHLFQAAPPFLSIATCLSFAIEAPLRGSAPILLGLPLHCRCRRILHLKPIGRAAGPVRRALALGRDAFEARAGIPDAWPYPSARSSKFATRR